MHPPRQSPEGCSLASASSESHERKISIAPKLRCHYAYQKQKSEVSNKHVKYAYMYYRGRTVEQYFLILAAHTINRSNVVDLVDRTLDLEI